MLGRNEIAYNHHPQHPRGTSEKNEKNEVATVPPELPLKTALFIFRVQPNFLLYSDKYVCKPTPTEVPIIIGEFRTTAAFIASCGGRAGVVITIIVKYATIVMEPNNPPLIIEFTIITLSKSPYLDEMLPTQTKSQDSK